MDGRGPRGGEESEGEGERRRGSWAVTPASQQVCQRRRARLEWGIMREVLPAIGASLGCLVTVVI